MFSKYLAAQCVLFGEQSTIQYVSTKQQTKWIGQQIIINQLLPRSALLCLSNQPNVTKNQIKQPKRLQENKMSQQTYCQQTKQLKNQQPDDQENQPLQILIRQKERQRLFDDQFYGMSIENHINILQFANSRSKSSEPDTSEAEFNPVFLSEILKSKSKDSNEQQQDILLQQIQELQMQPV